MFSPEQIAWFFYLGVPGVILLTGSALIAAKLKG
jgi:hypothetical protein